MTSIEHFKNAVQLLDRAIWERSGNGDLCTACGPIGERLEHLLLELQDQELGSAGARDSTCNIVIGTLDAIVQTGSHSCPLCGLVTRQLLWSKRPSIFAHLRRAKSINRYTTDDVFSGMLALVGQEDPTGGGDEGVDVSLGQRGSRSPCLEESVNGDGLVVSSGSFTPSAAVTTAVVDTSGVSEDGSFEGSVMSNEAIGGSTTTSNDHFICDPSEHRVQVSVDVIRSRGAIAIWLPSSVTGEENDEESELFLHPEDYASLFGESSLSSRARPRIPKPLPPQQGRRRLGALEACFKYCVQQHDHSQPTSWQASSSRLPCRLVDVDDMCVKSTSAAKFAADARYAALSYVWGKERFETLVSSNVNNLQRHGSLADATSLNVPRTITDAMAVARSFGLRYIWIDSLCIVQDELASKMKEIQRMHEIYLNAELTIVAATGDGAAASILDPGGTAEADDVVDFVERRYHHIGARGTRFSLDAPETPDLVEFSTWFTRGWTLQELLCSRRTLYFTPERAIFACNTGVWDDVDFVFDAADPSLGSPDEDPKGSFGASSTATYDYYVTMAERLSRRGFTKPDDVMRACFGLEELFLRPAIGDSVAGLPVSYFEAALMWQPAGRLERRIVAGAGGAGGTSRPPQDQLPTWSWAGWIGPVEYLFLDTVRLKIRRRGEWMLPDEVGRTVGIIGGGGGAGGGHDRTSSRDDWVHGCVPQVREYGSAKADVSIWKKPSMSRQPATECASTPEQPPPAAPEAFMRRPTSIQTPFVTFVSEKYMLRMRPTAPARSATRSHVRYFVFIDPAREDGDDDEEEIIGEMQADEGTLVFSYGEALASNTLPDTITVIPFANMDLSAWEAVMILDRYHSEAKKIFSAEFAAVLREWWDQDSTTDMALVLWVVSDKDQGTGIDSDQERQGMYRRVGLGYVRSEYVMGAQSASICLG